MKIEKASLIRLMKKRNQLKHDGFNDHRIGHIENELKKRTGWFGRYLHMEKK